MNRQGFEIEPADASARRRAIILMVVVAIMGVLLIAGARIRLDEAARLGPMDPGRAAEMIGELIAVAGSINAVASFIFAAWAGILGYRVFRERRWPPRGMRMARDTVVRRGRMAVMAASGFFALALLALASNLGVLALYSVLARLSPGG